MNPKCIKKQNEIQICFPERFRAPLEGKKRPKCAPKPVQKQLQATRNRTICICTVFVRELIPRVTANL